MTAITEPELMKQMVALKYENTYDVTLIISHNKIWIKDMTDEIFYLYFYYQEGVRS